MLLVIGFPLVFQVSRWGGSGGPVLPVLYPHLLYTRNKKSWFCFYVVHYGAPGEQSLPGVGRQSAPFLCFLGKKSPACITQGGLLGCVRDVSGAEKWRVHSFFHKLLFYMYVLAVCFLFFKS
ncbi:hypothetical protein [Alloalcanivorax marinus]|uniref:hypothetical protein n=1 Tax=Alloalcanivorax marinus TaxID=1177169 RepID=UPI00193198A9|nr:hypothetical protein [Alloalcanivorax marinus]MBL7251414.1 hypothetical protein [Alloalcanivorax marinus]